ncbi:hypothetical protein RYX45_21690, partial [Alkalihalophilus pseudofirmus]
KFDRKHCSVDWDYLFGLMTRCLTCKFSGHNQLKAPYLQLATALFRGKIVDYEKFLWMELLDVLKGQKQNFVVQFPSFISMCMIDVFDKDSLK